MVRQRKMSQTHFLLFAIASALMATPLVWTHTLVVALPLEMIALQIAWSRYNECRRGQLERSRSAIASWVEPLFVILAVLGIQFAEGSSGIYDRSFALQFVGTIPPALGPVALAGYVFKTTRAT